MTISADSQAILLLCSHLGLPSDSDITPLTLKDWNPLAKKLLGLSLRPESLLGRSLEDLQNLLSIRQEEAERLACLLERSGTLAIELEQLSSFGISVLTRADPEYPARYRQRLKDSAPTVHFYAGDKAR